MFTIGPLLYLLAKVGAMGTSMVPALAGYDISNIRSAAAAEIGSGRVRSGQVGSGRVRSVGV